MSIENAIIAKKGKRYPLMVDPQGQANKWLRNNLQHCQLSIINFSLGNYLKTIENAVTNGHPVLVEEVAEYLESSIDSLL